MAPAFTTSNMAEPSGSSTNNATAEYAPEATELLSREDLGSATVAKDASGPNATNTSTDGTGSSPENTDCYDDVDDCMGDSDSLSSCSSSAVILNGISGSEHIFASEALPINNGDAPILEVEVHSQKLESLRPLVDRRLRELECIVKDIEQSDAFVGAVEVLWYGVSSFFNIINVFHSLFKKATETPPEDDPPTQPDDESDRTSIDMEIPEPPVFIPTPPHNGYEELSDKTVEGCFLTLEKAVSGLVNTLAKTKTVERIPEKSLRRGSSTMRFPDKDGPWLSKNKLPWLRGLIADTIHGELFRSPTSDSKDDQVEHELEGFERMLTDLHANKRETKNSPWYMKATEVIEELHYRQTEYRDPEVAVRLSEKIRSSLEPAFHDNVEANEVLRTVSLMAACCALLLHKRPATYSWDQNVNLPSVNKDRATIVGGGRRNRGLNNSVEFEVAFTVFGAVVKRSSVIGDSENSNPGCCILKPVVVVN